MLIRAFLGFLLGALVGGVVGVALGFLWTWAFQTSCFEGYCAMLIFFTFMPIGVIVGALGGAVWFGRGGRVRAREP